VLLLLFVKLSLALHQPFLGSHSVLLGDFFLLESLCVVIFGLLQLLLKTLNLCSEQALCLISVIRDVSILLL